MTDIRKRTGSKGITYQVQQTHTSLPGWEPPNVAALWQKN